MRVFLFIGLDPRFLLKNEETVSSEATLTVYTRPVSPSSIFVHQCLLMQTRNEVLNNRL